MNLKFIHKNVEVGVRLHTYLLESYCCSSAPGVHIKHSLADQHGHGGTSALLA